MHLFSLLLPIFERGNTVKSKSGCYFGKPLLYFTRIKKKPALDMAFWRRDYRVYLRHREVDDDDDDDDGLTCTS